MDKEALLNIILSDINEVETLLKSFQGKSEIPSAFINLTERKLSHISEEFLLLKSLTADSGSLTQQVTSEPVINELPITHQTPLPEKQEVASPVEQTSNEQVQKTEPKEEVKNVVSEKTEVNISTEAKEETIITKEETTPVTQPIIQNKQETHQPIIEQRVAEAPKHENTIDKSKTLGEVLIGEKKSVNDLMSSTKESGLKKTLMGKPVNDLTKELGINDRFMFQRELFNSNSDLMSQTLKQLNEMPDFNSAHSFLSTNFSWDEELESTQSFYNYIKRKFLV